MDSDVILDVILEREGFEFSQKLLDLLLSKKIKMFTSPIVFTNSFYIISKLKGKPTALSSLKKIRKIFSLSEVNEKVVDKALKSAFSDFEDAIQYYSALESKVNFLVTRNKKDYDGDKITIISPEELLGIIGKPQMKYHK